MSSWKRDAASGLVVVVPILVSVYVVAWLYWRLKGIPILDQMDPRLKVVVMLALFAVAVLGIGYLMRTTLGSVVEGYVDKAANQLPLIRVIYNASKMAVETALSGTDDLQTPVKLETWNGMRMTAFKTGQTAPDGRDVLFLPTAPNITTGFVVEVEPDRYEELDERVEDALTRVLSAGFGDVDQEASPIPMSDVATDESDPDGETPADPDGEQPAEPTVDGQRAADPDANGRGSADSAVDDRDPADSDGGTSAE